MGRGMFKSTVERLSNAIIDHGIRSAGREMPQEITAFGLWPEKCHKRPRHSVCGPRNATRDHSSRSAGLESVCVLLEQEGLTRGPPDFVMRFAAKFVNYQYTYSEKLHYDFGG